MTQIKLDYQPERVSLLIFRWCFSRNFASYDPRTETSMKDCIHFTTIKNFIKTIKYQIHVTPKEKRRSYFEMVKWCSNDGLGQYLEWPDLSLFYPAHAARRAARHSGLAQTPWRPHGMEATLLERGGAKVIVLFLCTFRLDSAAVII